MSGKDQNRDKCLIWDPFIRPSYFQQDNNPEGVQLLEMTLASHLQEQGEGMIHCSLQVHPAEL